MSNYNLRSWSELPVEILQYILQNVEDKKTILQCLFVCKGWQKPAERIIYHTIDFKSYNPQLTNFVNTLKSSEYLGKLVNTFNFLEVFHTPGNPWDPKGHFEKLSDYCPNVEVMTTGHTCNSLWLRLLMEKDKWKKLQQIPKPFLNSDIQLYLATASAFNDRITTLQLVLKSAEFETDTLAREVRAKLLSDLSKFELLTSLGVHKPNGLQLEEMNEILDACPKLRGLIVRLTNASIENTQPQLDTITNRSVGLFDKIKFLKPKPNLKFLDYNITTVDGDETLNYIMRTLPHLKLLRLNQKISLSDERRDILYSAPTIASFLQYGININLFLVKYLTCEDISSVLIEYWKSEAYKATKRKISLTIDGNNFIGDSFPAKPSISMSYGKDVTVSYTSLEGTSTPVELIEKIGPLLTELIIKFFSPAIPDGREETIAIYQGYFLDHVFEYCPFLKRLELSFPVLQSCNPLLSTNASIEELDVRFSGINPNVLYQLSVRLPNLKRMKYIENVHTRYNGKAMKGRKMTINMPYTEFEQLHIEETPKRDFKHFFLKHSCERRDRYFYTLLKVGNTKLQESTLDKYSEKLDDKSSYSICIRCEELGDLTIRFGLTEIKF